MSWMAPLDLARTAPVLLASALTVASLGCNAFDDRPDDSSGPVFGQPAGDPRPAPIAMPAIPPSVTPTAPPPTNPGPECVEHPGLGVFPPECAGCLCSVDASRVLACNLDCLGLIECVVSRCGSDGTDITCITAECVDFVHEATAATELGDVLLGSCDPVCRTETVPDGCIVAIPLELDDGADGGVDCTAPIPDGVDPAVATPELAELTLDQGFGPDRLARVDGFDACGNQDAWFVPQDSMAPALELCPVSCARVSQGAIAAARFPCAAPLD